jgi:putative aldouronate transport system substrate-binding protein
VSAGTSPKAGEIALDASTKPMYNPVQNAPKNINWGALRSTTTRWRYRNAQVVPKDIYTGAGLERRLFEATKQYEAHEDKSQWFPRAFVWPDPSLSGELARCRPT